MKLEIFDVAHGACALLTCDDGRIVMIDCASNPETGWQPGESLKRRGYATLDGLFITNYDEDHARGLPRLLECVTVTTLWRNRSVTPDTVHRLKSEDGMGRGIEALCDLARRYSLEVPAPSFPDVQFQVFWNDYPSFDDENNLSLVLVLDLAGIRFVFPGDLEKSGWQALLKVPAFAAAVRGTHVLVASHHGRAGGICEDLFDLHGCNPFFVVISDKGYKHDTQLTVPYYRSKCRGGHFRGETRRVLTTRNDGMITFELSPGCWSVA